MNETSIRDRKEPFARIVKRDDISRVKAWGIRLAAILLSLLAGGLLILALGHNPFAVYRDMVTGSLATKTALIATAKIAIPLLGAAISIAPAFKMKFWNIGTEGQIMAGALAASYFALFQHGNMSRPVLILVMFAASVVAGGIWGFIPAFFKAKWGTNETLFTLMLNYIIIGIVKYLRMGPWKNPASGGFPKIAMFDDAARLPSVFGVNIGWIIVLALAVLMFIYMRYSKQGYEIAVVGESVRTSKYIGMNVPKVIIRTIVISGAIAGLVGCLIVAGSAYTLSDTSSGGYGFTAITVAWLGGLNPFAMIIITVFLAVLTKGANTIQTNFKIPASASDVLIGMILFFMLGCEFFIKYRLIFRTRRRIEVVPND
ncbi:nucleoside ABC transporter membrane protein [Sporobacter termitidis DSM 10068]|uniref:Nucleoside ABC transporter membrane protein n=1 Tax=Sporobacter termitidis DSM 10068 TaxID=1123282 RepID=A0A1M5YY62_9FIRM|nr:ABC transporter permease [Sporobacter termitidis]SHI16979.1 nucleoside ABC transporter membrane protein [Sporobacter termitidis DSM 10068]